MKKLMENAAARFTATVLLCLSILFSVFCLSGLVLTQEGYVSGHESFFDSEFARTEMHDLAMQVTLNALNGKAADDIHSAANTGWLIREADPKKSVLALVDKKNLSGKISVKSYFWFLNEAEILDLWQTDTDDSDVQLLLNMLNERKGVSAGRTDLYFLAPQNSDEFGYMSYQTYRFILLNRELYLPGLIIGTILSIVLLYFCLCASGRRAGRTECRLYFIDRIPLEILASVCVTAVVLIIRTGIEFLSVYYRYLYRGIGTIAVTVTAAVFFLLTLVFSLSRRTRSGTLLRSTLIYMIYGLLRKAVSVIPEMPVTAACAAGLWLLNCFTAFTQRPGLFMAMVMVINLAACIFVLYKTWCSQQAETATRLVVNGDLRYRMPPEKAAMMTPNERMIIKNLDSISEGMARAVEEKMKSERLKTELITNVSHDIKTPLTSIINYTDLLQKEEDEEKKQEYLEILSRNAARLKKLSEDLVEASKASTGNVHTEIVPLNLKEMTEQAIAEYEEKLKMADLTPVVTIHDPSASVMADGRLLWRVLSNLLSNCVKYAQPGTRVYISSTRPNAGYIMLSVKNVSRDILNISAQELMERFVRGDQSRSSEGSGLGLNIARSLTELMGGTFSLRIDGDLFRADITLPKADDQPETALNSEA